MSRARRARRRKPQGHCILAHDPPPLTPPLLHFLPWSTSYLTTQQDHPGFYNWVTLGPRLFCMRLFWTLNILPVDDPGECHRRILASPSLWFPRPRRLLTGPVSEFSCTLNHSYWRFLLYPDNLFVCFWSLPLQEKLQIGFPFSLGA